VASPAFDATVFPFILRGVSLIGIDSANFPMSPRVKIWQKLASEWKPDCLDQVSFDISLNELDQHIDLILQGKQKGRAVLNLTL
jgi:hypothetical protein